MIIEFDTYIGDAKVTLLCRVDGDAVEKVTPYVRGHKHPKLQRWAESFVNSNEGRDAVVDAIADEQENIRNSYPDRD